MKQQTPDYLDPLSPIEEDFVRALWIIGEGELSEIIAQMQHNDTPYTTIASMASKLERKGYVRKVGKKRGFLYAPIISEQEYSSRTTGYLVQNFFTGSYKSMVQHFASTGKISAQELQEIARLIEEGNNG